MADASADFFGKLAKREHEPLLGKTTGRVRFDLTDNDNTEHWLLEIDKGNVSVSRRRGRADCTVRMDQALFDGMVRGEVNAFAAVLRGAMTVVGDPRLLVSTQRLFPGPAAFRDQERGDNPEAGRR